jgi:Fic family protein
MTIQIHERKDWPAFRWDVEALTKPLADVSRRQGRLIGRMEGLGFKLREEAVLRTLTEDVITSSEIEGEILDPDQVRSSIARRLGMDIAGLTASERHVDGVVEMLVDATRNFSENLTNERLFGWHAALFPTGYSGMSKITIGAWRNDEDGPMQVVSGPIGKQRVHFTAPEAKCLKKEIKTFLTWFEDDETPDPIVKAALAHLWFVTIHPFEDGNGRIARAIADMALARAENSAQRFYSMSSQIRTERNAYYGILEATQKGNLDITVWLSWFLNCLDRALANAETFLADVLAKAKFWERHREKPLNERQHKVLNRLLDGFEGKLNTSKWAKLTKVSQDTAARDINDLIKKKILRKNSAGGRSTSYSLILDAEILC